MTTGSSEARGDVHLLASLYLPDVASERMDAGQRVVRCWVGSSITAAARTTP